MEKFGRVTSIGSTGELIVNAGSYSRAAIVAAFEMNGGVTAFAEWAEVNKTEFYTKLFPKLIGREAEGTKADDVEDLLLEMDAEEVPDEEDYQEADDPGLDDDAQPVRAARFTERMAGAADMYAEGEPE